jgi:hypothetical protein
MATAKQTKKKKKKSRNWQVLKEQNPNLKGEREREKTTKRRIGK